MKSRETDVNEIEVVDAEIIQPESKKVARILTLDHFLPKG